MDSHSNGNARQGKERQRDYTKAKGLHKVNGRGFGLADDVRFHRPADRVHKVLDLAGLRPYGVEGTRVAALHPGAAERCLIAQLVAGRASNLGHSGCMYLFI